MPQYARYESIGLTVLQFHSVTKGRGHYNWNYSQGVVRVAKLRDGSYWAESRKSWNPRWYKIPKVAGERAEKIEEFINSF